MIWLKATKKAFRFLLFESTFSVLPKLKQKTLNLLL